MSKRLYLWVLIFGSLPLLPAAGQTISWQSWEEGAAKAMRDNRKILLYVYTPSCGWCKKLEQETFAHAQVAQAVKADFTAIKLNAYESADLEFRGKWYRTSSIAGSTRLNPLVATLLEGRASFPALVFFDETQQILQTFAGFKQADELLPIVVYYGKDHYKNMPWQSFYRKFVAE